MSRKKEDKIEGETGPRKTREKTEKCNQMTALRFQTGGDTKHLCLQPPYIVGPESGLIPIKQ